MGGYEHLPGSDYLSGQRVVEAVAAGPLSISLVGGVEMVGTTS
jgi:hypothetical protein